MFIVLHAPTAFRSGCPNTRELARLAKWEPQRLSHSCAIAFGLVVTKFDAITWRIRRLVGPMMVRGCYCPAQQPVVIRPGDLVEIPNPRHGPPKLIHDGAGRQTCELSVVTTGLFPLRFDGQPFEDGLPSVVGSMPA